MVQLKTLGSTYDITEYVAKNYNENHDMVDLDTAFVEIKLIDKDALMGIDLSRKIPRMSRVKINENEYYVVQSTVDKKNDREYAHKLDLIELSYLMKLRPIPNISVTQPVVIYKLLAVGETTQVNGDLILTGKQTRYLEATRTIITPSNDFNIIDNNQIKKTGSYEIKGEIRLDARVPHYPKLPILIENVWVEIRFNNKVIYRFDVESMGHDKFDKIKVADVNVMTSLTQNSTLSVWFGGSSNYGVSTGGSLKLDIDELVVQYIPNDDYYAPEVFMDDVIEKVFGLTNNEFILDYSTKLRLSNIKAFEAIFTDNTVYSVLQKLARYVGAKLKINIIDGNKVVWLWFYDDMAKQQWIPPKSPQEVASADTMEYASSLITKNNNIVKNNFITESVVLKTTDGTNQITTDNVFIPTTYPIDRIRSISVNNVYFKGGNGPFSLVKITKSVVEKDFYNTLDNLANYDNRAVDNKNNNLWYERGKKGIHGVSFIGSQFQTWNANNTNRALYEVLAKEVETWDEMEPPFSQKYVDGGLDSDFLMTFRIEYYEMGEAEVIVNKNDVSGFEERINRTINANERVNNADLLGSFVRTKVNSIGNTKKAIQGYGQPPSLGSISNENDRVVGISTFGDLMYVATLVNSFIAENEYIGIENDKRLYIVPNDNIVRRRDLRVFEINLSKEPITTIYDNFSFSSYHLIGHLRMSPGSEPQLFALLKIDNKDFAIPFSVIPIGTTLSLTADMLDNYNAGFKKVKTKVSGTDVIYQKGVSYTNRFGTADLANIKVAYIFRTLNSNALPEQDQILYNSIAFEEEYNLKKDARESYSYSLQFIGQSKSDEILLYDGFAKYSYLAYEGKIKCAKINYTPTLNDRFINLNLADESLAFGKITIVGNKVVIDGEVGNYAWYDPITKELVLVLLNGNEIYFNVDRPGY